MRNQGGGSEEAKFTGTSRNANNRAWDEDVPQVAAIGVAALRFRSSTRDEWKNLAETAVKKG